MSKIQTPPPIGSQLSKITEQFVKFLSVDYPQSRAVNYKRLLAEDFSFSKKNRDRSKSGSKPARGAPATSTGSPREAGPSGRVILTQSRGYDGPQANHGRHEDRGRPMGSGNLDRSHSNQRSAPRDDERRDTEEAHREIGRAHV